MDDQAHIEELIALHTRRLHELEKQQALHGMGADPKIVIEIEGISTTIARLRAQRSVSPSPGSAPKVLVPETQQPAKHRGLIVLVGTGRPGEDPLRQSAWAAIKHHTPLLEVCWLIATGGEHGSLGVADHYKQECLERKIMAYVWAIGDPFSVQETYTLVQRIYAQEVPAAGLPESDVIADFTGAIRTMSAGIILACGQHRPMQYMYGRKEGIASVPRLIEFAP